MGRCMVCNRILKYDEHSLCRKCEVERIKRNHARVSDDDVVICIPKRDIPRVRNALEILGLDDQVIF